MTLISLDAGATDPDGDTLTYAASGLPAGLSINTATGEISGTISLQRRQWQPLRGQRHRARRRRGRRHRHLQLDGDQHQPGSDLRPEPGRPAPTPRVTVISLDAGATDPDGDTLTYAASGLPAGLSINTATGEISGTISLSAASGSPYAVSVTVRDGRRRRRHRHLQLDGDQHQPESDLRSEPGRPAATPRVP